MGPYSHYDVAWGIERVLLLYLILALALLGVLAVQLYRTLQAQDSSLARGTAADPRSQALIIAKRAILWVFGHKGDQRERTPFIKVGLKWVDRYRSSIIFRLLPVYGLYILTLVVLTRPIYFDGSAYQIFKYSPNLGELFILFTVYVSSNILFDYFSLRFTFSCITEALATKKYASIFAKNVAFASFLFLLSQLVSCFLWIYKRQDPTFPKFDKGVFYNFVEITLWPYAFVTGPGSSQITSDPFPGQLFITGTVFIPTITSVLLFVIFSAFLKITASLKTLLRSHKLDRLCRLLIRVKLVGLFETPEKLQSFGYCNLAFLVLLELSLASGVGAIFGRLGRVF
jgi:hypothetical protein